VTTLGPSPAQQQRERGAGVGGGRAAGRVDETDRVLERGLAPARLGRVQFGEAIGHVADEPERGEPEQVGLLAERAGAPPGQQRGGRLGDEAVAADDRRVRRRSARQVMIDHHRGRARQHRLRPRAEVGHDQTARGTGAQLVDQRLVPWRLALARDARLGHPAGCAQCPDQDRDRGQAVRVEMAEHQHGPAAVEAGERSREGIARRRARV
jgi:hypothetical protein